jgi:phosphatidylglycerophosphatase A
MPGSAALARWIATWFGVGRIPVAPGTAGAIAALPLHWLLLRAGFAFEATAIVALCCLGVWGSELTQRAMGEDDPQIIVVDEVAGMLIALLAAGTSLSAQVIAFVGFRVFDIFKPWPINRLEHLSHNGLAIMADDMLAGIFAALCVCAWLWLFR